MGLNELTIHELQDKIKKKEVSAGEIVDDVFKRIDAVDGKVHSYITLMRESAYEAAESADRDIRVGKINALTGTPSALKDIM